MSLRRLGAAERREKWEKRLPLLREDPTEQLGLLKLQDFGSMKGLVDKTPLKGI